MALLDELRKRACAMGITVRAARGGELERPLRAVRQLLESTLVGVDATERARLLAGAARLSEPVFTDISAPGEQVMSHSPHCTVSTGSSRT